MAGARPIRPDTPRGEERNRREEEEEEEEGGEGRKEWWWWWWRCRSQYTERILRLYKTTTTSVSEKSTEFVFFCGQLRVVFYGNVNASCHAVLSMPG